nr:MAG TPA: hypothetical protein [Podoviridae sp. ctY3D12]
MLLLTTSSMRVREVVYLSPHITMQNTIDH